MEKLGPVQLKKIEELTRGVNPFNNFKKMNKYIQNNYNKIGKMNESELTVAS